MTKAQLVLSPVCFGREYEKIHPASRAKNRGRRTVDSKQVFWGQKVLGAIGPLRICIPVELEQLERRPVRLRLPSAHGEHALVSPVRRVAQNLLGLGGLALESHAKCIQSAHQISERLGHDLLLERGRLDTFP